MVKGVIPPASSASGSFFKKIPMSVLLPCSSLALVVYLTLHGLVIPTLVIAIALSLILRSQLTPFWQCLTGRFYRRNPLLFQSLACATLTGLVLIDSAAMPAQAQFMNRAEQFLNQFTSQAGVDQSITQLVFGTLRGLFLLYLAITLIRVVQAARNDEDWQTLARTPLIIVVAVVVADVLTGLIVGNT